MVVLLVYDRCNLKEASCLLTVATVHGTEGRLDDALRVAKARVQTVTRNALIPCLSSRYILIGHTYWILLATNWSNTLLLKRTPRREQTQPSLLSTIQRALDVASWPRKHKSSFRRRRTGQVKRGH